MHVPGPVRIPFTKALCANNLGCVHRRQIAIWNVFQKSAKNLFYARKLVRIEAKKMKHREQGGLPTFMEGLLCLDASRRGHASDKEVIEADKHGTLVFLSAGLLMTPSSIAVQ